VGGPDDKAWYREIAFPPKDGDKDKGKKKDRGRDKDKAGKEGEAEKGKSLPRLRQIAFKAVAGSLAVEELEEATGDPDREIRKEALLALIAADEKRGAAAAEEAYSNFQEASAVRAIAARALASAQGADAAKRFVKDVHSEADMPLELVNELAELIARYGDQEAEKELGKTLSAGKPNEQLFALRALKNAKGEKLEKAILKLVKSKDVALACAAMQTLGLRGAEEAAPELEKMIEKGKDYELIAAALDGLAQLRKGQPEWRARLVEFAGNEAREIRNAAIAQLGKLGAGAPLDVLAQALSHADWATRLAALRAIEAVRQPAGVGLLVERMATEQGRMKHEVADVLFRLTGQFHGLREALWKAWWEKEGAGFQVITPGELAKREKEQEIRRLKEITQATASFFGVRITSRRVVFVVDVSGSMEEKAQSGETRMELARKELLETLDGLDPATFFNVIAFSAEVWAWRERVGGLDTAAGKGQKSLIEQAKDFTKKLRAGGGTNIYGALEQAFQDPEVDTIYLMTDGEPSVGDVIDPTAIREEVQRWNDRRGVVIHTIAFGGTYPILEWLAEDNGGTYRFVR
jgi:HEAT repeat protein